MSSLRHAVRLIVTRPGFSVIVIVTLALGIGVNSAFFSIVNAVLLRPPAVAAPERLMNVYTTKADGSGYGALSYPDYQDVRALTPFDGVAGYSGLMASLNDDGRSEMLFGELVTGNYFSVLGVRPQRGRFFLPEEDRTPMSHPVIVLGDGLWRRRFAADPSIIGRTIAVNGRQFTVVGIAPPEFTGSLFRGFAVDVWVPVMMMSAVRTNELANRGERWMFVKGRLARGATPEQAASALRALGDQLAARDPATNAGRALRLIPSSDVRVTAEGDGAIIPAATFMLLAVGLILLIACTNLANLMLARAAARQHEIAVRAALGASRWRIVREMVGESAVLSVAGGMAGLLLAAWLARLLVAFKPPLPVAISFDVGIDVRVIGYTAALTGLTTILFGLVPAIHATRGDLGAAMRHRSGGMSARGRRYGLRNLLLIPQVALSVTLLVVAGLFARSVANAGAVRVGFDLERTATIALNLAPSGYDETRARTFYRELSRRALTLPGVSAVAVADRIPLDLYGSRTTSLAIEGGAADVVERAVQHARVEPTYFATLGIPVVRGRGLTTSDTAANTPVAIISVAASRRWWPGRDAIGERIYLDGEAARSVEIVGVAADAKVQTLGEAPEPLVYRPLATGYPGLVRLIVRTSGDPAALVPALRRFVSEIDPAVAVFESQTMDQHLGVMLFPFRMAAALSTALGAFALLLAAVGLYGVLAFGVAERASELALRIALGAQRAAVLRLVVADGLHVVAIGLALGLILALALSRVLASWLFGIQPTDPLVFIGMPAVLIGVAVMASIVPARRATSVDPMGVLREGQH